MNQSDLAILDDAMMKDEKKCGIFFSSYVASTSFFLSYDCFGLSIAFSLHVTFGVAAYQAYYLPAKSKVA